MSDVNGDQAALAALGGQNGRLVAACTEAIAAITEAAEGDERNRLAFLTAEATLRHLRALASGDADVFLTAVAGHLGPSGMEDCDFSYGGRHLYQCHCQCVFSPGIDPKTVYPVRLDGDCQTTGCACHTIPSELPYPYAAHR